MTRRVATHPHPPPKQAIIQPPPETIPIRPGEDLPWPRLEAYLRAHLPDLTTGPFRVRQFPGGHANLTYWLNFGERELVLRRPPFGKIAPGAHDMQREYRVLSQLWSVFPAAPRAYHLCTDASVVGSDFVVMERRQGLVLRTAIHPSLASCGRAPMTDFSPAERCSDALMKACADLHLVDPAAAGLADLGRPAGFTDRQLRGWTKRWTLARLDDRPGMDQLMDRLRADVPAPQRVSLVHGDLKFDNCMFAPGEPDRVTTVLDWDMTTLGDPLIDLGGLLSYWPEDTPAGRLPTSMMTGDWPTKDWLKARYATHSGLDLSRMNWYEAFACYKSAVITQQLYARFVAGKTQDRRMQQFGRVSEVFTQLGLAKIT